MSTLTVNRPTSLGLSALLHAGFIALGFIGALFIGRGEEVLITPVTLIGPEMMVDPGYAEAAPEPEEAMTEDPVEILPPEPVAEEPTPEPKPAPKTPPTPKVAPTPKSPPAVAPKGKSPAPPRPATPAFDMSKLERDIAAAAPRSAGAQQSGGRQGPTQPQRALENLLSEGQARAATADALNAIGVKIMRNWRINCANTGERNARVTLRLELDRSGGLVRSEVVGYRDLDTIRDPALKTAATLAMSAARAAAPFDGLPEQTYSDWRSKTYEFQGDVACEGR